MARRGVQPLVSETRRVITVTIDRGTGGEKNLVTYRLPVERGESVLGVLQYVYENLDSSLAFYSSCRIGLCTGCLVRVNGKAVLACTTAAEGDMLIEPYHRESRVRDLVVERQ